MIPAIINIRGGTASQARKALESAGTFQIREVEPDRVTDATKTAIHHGIDRIAVAGGDGTICAAAAAVVGSRTALAVLPGGTLNHFARDHGIPVDLEEATRVAADGNVTKADVAYAGGHLFLNTSSVGAYVSYVRVRERFEKYVGYRLASFAAGIRLLFTMKPVSVSLEIDGQVYHYNTPLVFIGVGEREFQAPTFGNRVQNGKHCLHVIVVRERRSARILALGLAAAARGVAWAAKTPELDSYFVDRCIIGVQGKHQRVALDGELVKLVAPIEYKISVGALDIVVPVVPAG